ncbi:MAG: SusC/RagA family TonB-linked outer membrane protein, partial [Bacteroidota bacterium]
SSYFEIQSLIGRVSYDFRDKYLISASIRRDASTRFSPDVRVGYFPSVSAGWRVSEESFLEGVSFIDDLKIRGSWGQTGNVQFADYQYIPLIFGNLNIDFNDQGLQPGNTLRQLTNEQIGWETTIMTNAGFDAIFFDGRLTVAADYFINTTDDMIIGVPIPFSQGFDQDPVDNVGSVENRGFELLLGYNDNIGDLNFSINGNFSTVTNEVVELNNPDETIFGPAFEGLPLTITQEGFPIASFFGFETDGLFQNQAEIDNHATQPEAVPGDIRFKDNNGDGEINAADRVRIGSFIPDVTYGLTINAEYKGFDMSAFFQGVAGNQIFNTNIYDLQGMTRLFNAGTDVLDRWQQEGDRTDVPIARNGDPNLNARVSDRYIEDGDYLRLKNLTIGYTLPRSIFGGTEYIKNVRIYVGAQNLFTITGYTGYDPEIGVRQGLNASLATGVDFGQFPQARTFIGGIQIKL